MPLAFYLRWLLIGATLSVCVFALACGGDNDATEAIIEPATSRLTAVQARDFEAAKIACNEPDATEPAVEYYPAIRCANGAVCCVWDRNWGSYYDYARHAIVLPVGDAACNEHVARVNLPCEFQNACTCEGAGCVDRCRTPCTRHT